MQEGADRIIERILGDAKARADEIMQGAEEEKEKILSEARQKAENQETHILEQARKDAEEQKRRIIGVAQLEARKEILSSKQELISEAFDQALNKLEDLDDETYLDVIGNMLLEQVETGSEKVSCSARDMKRIPAAFWQEINDKLAQHGKQGRLTLSEETRDIRGGFILLSGGVELNCSFEALLEMQREDLEPEVAAILFP
ncbi:MAG: V-type ATP synthase subunit E family protein [Bacillota bacterium]|nr:V-type ATP synthase subunit E family protein [Bacillota bacterium]